MLDNFYINSDFSRQCISRITTDCRPYRSSLSGCWFGLSGSSRFVVAFSIFGCPIADLCQEFVRIAHAQRQDWRFRLGYDLLILVRFLIFCYIRNSDIFIIKHIIPNLLIKFFCGHFLRYFKGCVGTRKLIM